MSDYRRLISYLYSYNNGVKSKNVGFAKTERKGGTVKLWINMKGAFAPEENFRVYFFVRGDGLIAGINMGECAIRGGAGQFYSACREEELTVAFDELCGIYIMGAGRGKIFASQWDDKVFSVDKIVLLSEIMKKNEHKEDVQSQETRQQEKSSEEKEVLAAEGGQQYKESLPQSDGDAYERIAENADAESELPVWQRPIKEVVISGMTGDDREAHAAIKLEKYSEEPLKQKSIEDDNQGILHASEEKDIFGQRQTKTAEADASRDRDMFFDGKEPVLAFSEDEIYDCVDIDLTELSKLPPEARRLMNNSFVNHGYFNFHHLLLGKKGENMLVVGVPGVYNRREKMTANMLGFDKFKFSMRADVKMNHFGYWYREFIM